MLTHSQGATDIDPEAYKQALRKQREYDELMKFVVKLTKESEQLKTTNSSLEQRCSELDSTNATLQDKLKRAQSEGLRQRSRGLKDTNAPAARGSRKGEEGGSQTYV